MANGAWSIRRMAAGRSADHPPVAMSHGMNRRGWVLAALLVVASPVGVTAQPVARTLVLPFRTVGVDVQTSRVFASLVGGELETAHVPVVPASALPGSSTVGDSACDESACAVRIARTVAVDRVVFGTLTRLGSKVIVRVRSQRVDATTPDYSDQLTATGEDDLDAVARRIALTLAGGQSNAGPATVGSITEQETRTPRRRASRTGIGLRGVVLLPAGNSYTGSEQLAGLRFPGRYETPSGVFVETTPLLGLLWGNGNVEWTILDVAAGRVLGTGDFAPYVLGGVGLHSIHLERKTQYTSPYGYPYEVSNGQNATTLTGDVGVGWMMLRTYDFSLLIDLRYHVVFGSFDRVGGKGAHGLMLSFGTTH